MGLWLTDWRGGPMPRCCWKVMSCGAIAKVLFLDDETSHRLYRQEGIEGLAALATKAAPAA
jgi:hypothetical protein